MRISDWSSDVCSSDLLAMLAACLRGEPPAFVDWPAVIGLANRSWVTPALYASLARAHRLEDVPADVRAYLEFIHGRSLQRNLRLRAQLAEAVRTLNRAGIEPTLLKGATLLFTASDDRISARMMNDLDLMVEGAEDRKSTRLN